MPRRILIGIILSLPFVVAGSIAQEENCASADYVFNTTSEGLSQILLENVNVFAGQLPNESPALLDVTDCSGDGNLDIFIAWSASPQNLLAQIQFDPELCISGGAVEARITLIAPDGVALHARAGNGDLIESVDVIPGSQEQTVLLAGSSQISYIEVEGTNVCLILICWSCVPSNPTPTPSPTVSPYEPGCVAAEDAIAAPTSDLEMVDLGPVKVFQGLDPQENPIPLSVFDCSGNGRLDIFIPSSEPGSARPAAIEFDNKILCGGFYPIYVEISVSHSDYCILRGYDGMGTLVSTAVASPGPNIQILSLRADSGIASLQIEGAEICLGDICWTCLGPIPSPTPLPDPGPIGCILPSDYYQEPHTGLSQVFMGSVLISEGEADNGTPRTMDILDCSGDGLLDVFIPSSDVFDFPPVTLSFDPSLCLAAPLSVGVVLKHSGAVTLRGYNINELEVANTTVTGATEVTALTLLADGSLGGINTIQFLGTDICILEICWACGFELPTPTPTPGPGDCVEPGDFYSTPVSELAQVDLGPVIVTEATMSGGVAVPLQIVDCSLDGRLDILIPWSEGSAETPATIEFDTASCLGKPAEFVEVTLRSPSLSILHGFNLAGAEVATVTTTAPGSEQTLSLRSLEGIAKIEVEGSNICLSEICWLCDAPPPPTPTVTPLPTFPNTACIAPHEVFPATATGTELAEAFLQSATVIAATMPDATTSPLVIQDCSNDGLVDLYIPWSEISASSPARIVIATEVICGGVAPKIAEVTVICGSPCTFYGINSIGIAVATQTAIVQAGPQTLVFDHPTGIEEIRIEGADICLQEICWTCEILPPTPTPTTTPTPTSTLQKVPDDCVRVDVEAQSPLVDVSEATLGSIRFTQALQAGGTPEPLSVLDCNNDLRLEVSIPWSEATASQKAAFEFDSELCGGAAPHWVQVLLTHNDSVTLSAKDESGAVVDVATAGAPNTSQNLILASPDGIRRVEFEGAEICVSGVCWICVLPEFVPTETQTPTFTNTPVSTATPTSTVTPTPSATASTMETPTFTPDYNLVVDNFINANDLLELLARIRSGSPEEEILLDFSLFWLNQFGSKLDR